MNRVRKKGDDRNVQGNELVSVIVSVYNAERYLAECVESIVTQTYENLEIILLDDGSSDHSLQICREYAENDSRVCVYHHENKGVSATRNEGIDKANGSYVVFVDADDVVEPDMLTKMVECSKDGFMSVCRFERLRDGKNANAVDKKEGSVIELDKDAFWELYLAQQINAPWNKLYERDLLKSGIRFPEELSLGEDLLFNLAYLEHVKGFIFHDCVYYRYRETGAQSLSQKYRENAYDIQHYLYQKVRDFCECHIEMSEDNWKSYYWDYFKALQNSIDAEYEHCGYRENTVIEKMKETEFECVFSEIEQRRNTYRMVNRMEIFLYKCGLWKADYWMRRYKRRIKEFGNSKHRETNVEMHG